MTTFQSVKRPTTYGRATSRSSSHIHFCAMQLLQLLLLQLQYYCTTGRCYSTYSYRRLPTPADILHPNDSAVVILVGPRVVLISRRVKHVVLSIQYRKVCLSPRMSLFPYQLAAFCLSSSVANIVCSSTS